MSHLLRLPALAAALVALAASGPAARPTAKAAAAAPAPPAGRNVMLPYPAKAPVVVAINGLERTRERLAKTLSALPKEQAEAVKTQTDAGLEVLLKDRKLTAIPKDGRAFVVLHDITTVVEDEPALSFLLPVTSYKEFRDTFLTPDERKSYEAGKDGVDTVKLSAFGEERVLHLVDLKEYVAVTVAKGTAEVYTGKYTRAMTGAMGADVSSSFLAADVALYVNMDVINDLYGDNIRQFKGLIDFALMQAQGMGMIPGLNKKQLDQAKTMITGVFQAVEDSQGVLLAAEFRPEGVNLRAQVRFADDSPSGKMLKAETPTPLSTVADLPRGLNSYSGSKFGKKFSDLMNQFVDEFAGPEDNEAAAAEVGKLRAEIAAAGPQGDFSASAPPDTTLHVTPYKDAAKAAAAYTRLYKALPAGGHVANLVLKDKPKVTEKAQTYGNFTFAEVRLTFDYEASLKDVPDNIREATLESLKKQMREKTTTWVGTDGKVVVQLTAKDWDAAQKVLAEYVDAKTPVGTEPGFALTRKNLPADATLLMMAETSELITTLVEQAKTVGQAIPGGGGIPPIGKVKPVKGEATFVGVALTLKPETATLDVFIPGTGLNVAARMLAPLFKTID